MKDRLSKYPGRVKLTPVAGQEDTFDMIRADEPEEAGTPLNKNSLLKDETAEAIGLDPASDPTPDDAFGKLAEKCDLKAGDITETIRTDLGENWVLCNGDIVPEGEYPELRELLPYNTEWRPFSRSASFQPFQMPGKWLYLNKAFTADGSSSIARLYDVGTDTYIDIPCPTIADATGTYAIIAMAYDDGLYYMCVAERRAGAKGMTYFYTSEDMSAWELRYSESTYFTANSSATMNATCMIVTGGYVMWYESGKESTNSSNYNWSLKSIDKEFQKSTRHGSGTASTDRVINVIPGGRWRYGTNAEVYKAGTTTIAYFLYDTERIVYFNDRYYIGHKTGTTSDSIKVYDLSTEKQNTISTKGMINSSGHLCYFYGVQYDRNTNEWVFYLYYSPKNGEATKPYIARISREADPTDYTQYRSEAVDAFPTLSEKQMHIDGSQMNTLESKPYLRDPNQKYLPTHDGDTYKYIYAGGADE